MNGWDRATFLWINYWPEAWSPFLTFFSVSMNYVVVKVFFIFLILWYLFKGARWRAAALLSILSIGAANGLTDVLKHLVPMHRPFQPEALGSDVILRVGSSVSSGTASAHSANMAALAVVTTLLLGRWGWPWVFVAILTGISRVYVGAHFPSQVVLGWTCGSLMGWIVVTVYRRFEGLSAAGRSAT